MILSRRKFLWVAPAIVAAPSLMKIKPFEPIFKSKVVAWGPFDFNGGLKAGVLECFKDSMDAQLKYYKSLSDIEWNIQLDDPNNQTNVTVQSFLVRA